VADAFELVSDHDIVPSDACAREITFRSRYLSHMHIGL